MTVVIAGHERAAGWLQPPPGVNPDRVGAVPLAEEQE